MTTWIGVDPGSRWSGICAREGAHLIGFAIIDRNIIEPGSERPGVPTKEAVVEAVAGIVDPRTGEPVDPATARIAIEDTVRPVGHLGMTDVEAVMRTAEVVGYLQCAYPGAVLVRPNKHGRGSLASYPRDLVSRGEVQHADRARTWLREAPKGSTMRHARSAYDVAGAGASAARLQLALANRRP